VSGVLLALAFILTYYFLTDPGIFIGVWPIFRRPGLHSASRGDYETASLSLSVCQQDYAKNFDIFNGSRLLGKNNRF